MVIASRVSLLAWLFCITSVGVASPVAPGNKDAPQTAADGGEVGEIVSAAVSGIAKEPLEEGEGGRQESDHQIGALGTSKVSV